MESWRKKMKSRKPLPLVLLALLIISLLTAFSWYVSDSRDLDSKLFLPIILKEWSSILITTGDGILQNSGQLLGDRRSTEVKLGDMDGDGDLDAFVAGWGSSDLWMNNGNGIFRDSGAAFGEGDDLELGDLDLDGDLDVFIVRGYSIPNQVWLNDGNGKFLEFKQFTGDTSGNSVALGDVDDDGDLDAFVGHAFPAQPNFVWLNDGTGLFYDSGQRLGNSNSVSIALADIDNDDDLDAIVGNQLEYQPAADTVWINDGTGKFTDSGQRLGGFRTKSVTMGDIDCDGDLDALMASCCRQGSRIWFNDGSGIFDVGQELDNNDNQEIDLGDIDGDGDLDALIVNFGGEENDPIPDGLWLNVGKGRFVLHPDQILSPSYSASGALGDLDGDGDLDAYIANIGGDMVYINQG
jgi:hypothetical protein